MPSERKKGYGTLILKLALKKAREIGLKKVLLTCSDTNVGSRKIIEACGGIQEDSFTKEDGHQKLRFSINVE